MAMLPFCGYHMGDYFAHWLDVGDRVRGQAGTLPRIFYVNWFRKDDEGKFIWPGFGENSRVLKWIVQRVAGEVDAVETPIGRMPVPGDLDITGLTLSDEDMDTLLSVDVRGWRDELDQVKEHYAQFGDKLPPRLARQLQRLEANLEQAQP